MSLHESCHRIHSQMHTCKLIHVIPPTKPKKVTPLTKPKHAIAPTAVLLTKRSTQSLNHTPPAQPHPQPPAQFSCFFPFFFFPSFFTFDYKRVTSCLIRLDDTAQPLQQHLALLLVSPQRTRLCIRQHTSAYVSIRQHVSAYAGIRQHTSAYVSSISHCSRSELASENWF